MQEQREELRLALVMNGGVSLAVWMGGVTNEIFRIVKGQHPVYAELLAMTHTTARVDVISGTSAGGINGAALSLALLYRGDFARLRQVWLDTGAFASLLRAPLGYNPGSLLRGDDFFLPEIQEAFRGLARDSTPISSDVMPIDLRLTTTLLRGEQGNSVDDLGTPIHDVDYRAQFRFRNTSDKQDFNDREPLVAAISRAARSTASFPFAFEPSAVKDLGDWFVDSNDQPIAVSKLEDTQTVAPRFVVDGGVLNNKPFRGALRSIFSMPAQSGVRRVLAYINPDPGDGAPGKPRSDVPPLSSVLAASLFGIPQSQSIADQLEEIQDHNDHVRTRRDSVFNTVLTVSRADLDRLPSELYGLYRQRRLSNTFDDFVYQELPAAARRLKLPPSSAIVGRRGREHLLSVFMSVHWRDWIPPQWPADLDADQLAPVVCSDEDWEWGLFPVEFAIKVTLDILRRTQRLSELDPLMASADSTSADQSVAPPVDQAPKLGPDWSDPGYSPPVDANPSLRTRFMAMFRGAAAGSPDSAAKSTWEREAASGEDAWASEGDTIPVLKQAWRDIYRCVSFAQRLRHLEQKQAWDRNAEVLVKLMNDGRSDRSTASVDGQTAGAAVERAPEREPNLQDVTAEVFAERFAFLVTPKRKRRCGLLMRHVASVIVEVSGFADGLAERVASRMDLRESELKDARALTAFIGWLSPPGSPCCTVIRRLLQLEVIEHATNPHDALEDDSLIELAQISGNSSSPLGGPQDAQQKLLGLQLAHFGAFYKRSWRANDWTYGRLDGSERMVKILLNPDRLLRYFRDPVRAASDAYTRIRKIACDDIVSPFLQAEVQRIWLEMEYERLLQAELAFLGDRRAAVPDALPVAAAVITLRLHFGILRDEIEPLLIAIAADRSAGADAMGASETLVQLFARNVDKGGKEVLPFSPSQAQEALNAGLIAGKDGETLLGEAGSDLFTRTLAHTMATLQSVLTSPAAKLGPVSVFFAALKLPVLGFYFVVRGLTRQSRTSAALHAGILAVGLALVAMQLVLHSTEKPTSLPGPMVSFGWALLAYGLLFSVVSSPRVIGAVLAIALLGIAYLLKLPAWPLLGPLAAVALLWLSVRYRFLALLQWVLGIAAILIAAWLSQSEHFRPLSEYSFSLANSTDRLAAFVCLVLSLAGWQASTWSQRVEGEVRKLWQGFRST